MAEIDKTQNQLKQRLQQVLIENENKSETGNLSMEVKEKGETKDKVVDDHDKIEKLMRQTKIGSVKDIKHIKQQAKIPGGEGNTLRQSIQVFNQMLINSTSKPTNDQAVIDKLMKQAQSHPVEESKFTPKEVYLGGKPNFKVDWDAPHTKKCGCPTDQCECKPHFLTLGDLPNLNKPVGIRGRAAKLIRKLLSSKPVPAPKPAGLLMPQLQAAMDKEIAACKELKEKGELLIDPGFCSSSCLKFVEAVKEHGNLVYKQQKLDKYLKVNEPSPKGNVAPNKDNIETLDEKVEPLKDKDAPIEDNVAMLNITQDPALQKLEESKVKNEDALKEIEHGKDNEIVQPGTNNESEKVNVLNAETKDSKPEKQEEQPRMDVLVAKSDHGKVEDRTGDKIKQLESADKIKKDVNEKKKDVENNVRSNATALSEEIINQVSLACLSDNNNNIMHNDDLKKLSTPVVKESSPEKPKEESLDVNDETETKDVVLKVLDTTSKLRDNEDGRVSDDSMNNNSRPFMKLDVLVINSNDGSLLRHERKEKKIKELGSKDHLEAVDIKHFGSELPNAKPEQELSEDNGDSEMNNDELKETEQFGKVEEKKENLMICAMSGESIEEMTCKIDNDDDSLLCELPNETIIEELDYINDVDITNAESLISGLADKLEKTKNTTSDDVEFKVRSGYIQDQVENEGNQTTSPSASGIIEDVLTSVDGKREVCCGDNSNLEQNGGLVFEVQSSACFSVSGNIKDTKMNNQQNLETDVAQKDGFKNKTQNVRSSVAGEVKGNKVNYTQSSNPDRGQCNVSCGYIKTLVQNVGLQSGSIKIKKIKSSNANELKKDNKMSDQKPDECQVTCDDDKQDSGSNKEKEQSKETPKKTEGASKQAPEVSKQAPESPKQAEAPKQIQKPISDLPNASEDITDDKMNIQQDVNAGFGMCGRDCAHGKINEEGSECENLCVTGAKDNCNEQDLENSTPDEGQCKPSCEYLKNLAKNEGLENQTKNIRRYTPMSVSDEIIGAMMKLNNEQDSSTHLKNSCDVQDIDLKEEHLADIDKAKPTKDLSFSTRSETEIRLREKHKDGNRTSIYNTKSLTISNQSVEIKNVEVTKGNMPPCSFGSSQPKSEEDKKQQRCNCIIKECRIKLKFKEFFTSIGQRSYKKGPFGRWQHSVI